MRVLVTGGTGYVGGRLIPRLLAAGHRVTVLVRDPARVAQRSWEREVEVRTGDLLDPATLPAALAGSEAVYYLVHSMYAGGAFAALDRRAAENFLAAAPPGVRVIYLGGLLPSGSRISSHLQSRADVGMVLRAGGSTLELRAGPIVGSGSASFEMVRYLTERLPVMIAPRWILNPVQPIAIEDMLRYLVAALVSPAIGVVEVGAEPLAFRQMMEVYAALRGYRRRILPVPVLAPGLAARWVGLVTPIPNRLAVPLVRGMVSPVVADTTRARALFPEISPLPYREAVAAALADTLAGRVQTRWSGALAGALPGGPTTRISDREGLIQEERTLAVPAPPEAVFSVFTGLGAARGWLAWNWAWRLRGGLDRLIGGPGLRRGRRDPERLLPGEAVDFWRVEELVAPRRLRLRAEMKLPGRAWLQWEAIPSAGGTRLVQNALFEPHGPLGLLYWWLLYPMHMLIFRGLVRAIAREARRLPEPPREGP